VIRTLRPRDERASPRRFSLRRPRGGRRLVIEFSLISAVLAALLGLVMTTWLSSFIRHTNISHAQDTAKYSINLVLSTVGYKINQPSRALTPTQYAQTTALLSSMVATGKYLGATAWSTPTTVSYSATTRYVTLQQTSRPQVSKALRGNLTSTVVTAPDPKIADPTERQALAAHGPQLEVFAPVRIENTIVAAVQLYQPWHPVEKLIQHETRQMILLVTGGLAVLWAGLLGLVLSASRTLRRAAEENAELALYDVLTGLPNRKLLRERVEQALRVTERSGRKIALLLLDLDRFKEVNDTLGHHYGDLLLQQIGPRLEGVLRTGDCVARLGGDEFVVLLTGPGGLEGAETAAERIVSAFAAPFQLADVEVDVDVSIGIALSPDHGRDFGALLQRADIGMYEAKAARSGWAVYSSAADAGTPQKLAMVGQLRKAITSSEQIVLHYQPKADLRTGRICGVEALCRWEHPTRGLLPPGEFIPLAERTGLIHPLTMLVLDCALGQLATWDRQGIDLCVSVNISARSLLDERLPELVQRMLHEHAIAAERLTLELTESAIMADPSRAIATLTALQALGVALAIDDFGTGYSSMAYLEQLPIHQLKIDKSFVRKMTAGSTVAAIVRSCIELGQNLGLSVIAEGVETADVWNQLTDLNCDQAQGYYLARPMPASALMIWLSKRRTTPGSQLPAMTLTKGP
jgi:diguanylate cyclase (GGDEF)-like protein